MHKVTFSMISISELSKIKLGLLLEILDIDLSVIFCHICTGAYS